MGREDRRFYARAWRDAADGYADRSRPDFIKDLAFAVRSRSKNIVLVIGSINDGKPTLTVALGDDIVAQGVNAGVVVREAAKAINGGGGGQPFLATAGGKNPDGIQAAIDDDLLTCRSRC